MHDFESLCFRLEKSGRPVAVVVGSGLSITYGPPKQGVPDVAGMVERLRAYTSSEGCRAEFDAALAKVAHADHYQTAFSFLATRFSSTEINRLVHDAVLSARLPDAPKDFVEDGDPVHWHLPKGTAALGRLLAEPGDRFGPILTTNFDPLISLAIKHAGGIVDRRVLQMDGGLETAADSSAGARVVHLHGYWRDSETRHLPQHLLAPRPMLAGSLRRLLRGRSVLVAAYGGWPDVFMETLAQVLAEPDIETDVLWCFRKDEGNTRLDYKALFERFEGHTRFVPYYSIDAHTLFERLAPAPPTAVVARVVLVSADDVNPWREAIEVALTRAGVAVELLRTGTLDERLTKVRDADVLVLVVAHRLGAVVDGTSWMQRALDAATLTVTVRVANDAAWGEKKEQDELLTPGVNVAEIVERVQLLTALKQGLVEPLEFGTQATIAMPDELGTAVAERVLDRVRARANARSGRRVWAPHIEYGLQPAQHFQGRQALLERLRGWWADPASPERVFALIAIGGAGKTAIAERTLAHVLRHPAGGGVFVWSFYENPSSSAFLLAACEYFAGHAGEDVGGRLHRLKQALRNGEPHLLLLDGLERVQAEGRPGHARGSLDDASLRQLLQVLAGGLGRARALVTSRFPLVDLDSWKGSGLAAVALDDLDPGAARGVLWAWGVRSTNARMDALADRVGRHALSIAVLGSYIGNFGNGDPAVADQLDLSEAGEFDPQANKLLRLLAAYAMALPAPERQLMARLALFPKGIEPAVLDELIRNSAVAGVLVNLKQFGLGPMLDRLVARGLAFTYRGDKDGLVYTAHPFVRDAFAGLLDVQKADVHRVMAEQVGAGLEARPGGLPTEPAELDRYENWIEQLLGAGEIRRAFELYWYRLGSYEHLGKRIGDFVRGIRILARFPDLTQPKKYATWITEEERLGLLNALALMHTTLGELEEADRLNRADYATRLLLPRSVDRSMSRQNASDIALLRGRLPVALAMAEEALDVARKNHHKDWTEWSLAYAAHARALLGQTETAMSIFQEATKLKNRGEMLYSVRGLRKADLHRRLGEYEPAHRQTMNNLAICIDNKWYRSAARCRALLAQLALPDHPARAEPHLVYTREWATRTGDFELELIVHQLTAALAFATGDPDAALADLDAGIHAADHQGYGLLSIDLRVDRARVHLARADPLAAQRDAVEALTRAANPECAYAWGEADAGHVLGEAHLARHDLINARRRFTQALAQRERIGHPHAQATRDQLSRLPPNT